MSVNVNLQLKLNQLFVSMWSSATPAMRPHPSEMLHLVGNMSDVPATVSSSARAAARELPVLGG